VCDSGTGENINAAPGLAPVRQKQKQNNDAFLVTIPSKKKEKKDATQDATYSFVKRTGHWGSQHFSQKLLYR
jgi:hypothetical protein